MRNLLLRLLAAQHLQLQRMRIWYMATLLHALPRQHLVQPRLEVRELLDVDAGPAGTGDPAPVRDVGDGDVVADQVAGLRLGEVRVKDGVEAAGFVDVAVYAVFDGLGRVAVEVLSFIVRESVVHSRRHVVRQRYQDQT